MKKLVILLVILFAIIILGDLVNKIGANEKMTVEGYILNKEGVWYLITDEDFDVKLLRNNQVKNSSEAMEEYIN